MYTQPPFSQILYHEVVLLKHVVEVIFIWYGRQSCINKVGHHDIDYGWAKTESVDMTLHPVFLSF